jgi:hypothetical protein
MNLIVFSICVISMPNVSFLKIYYCYYTTKGSITTITQRYGRLIISIVLISHMILLIYSIISK